MYFGLHVLHRTNHTNQFSRFHILQRKNQTNLYSGMHVLHRTNETNLYFGMHEIQRTDQTNLYSPKRSKTALCPVWFYWLKDGRFSFCTIFIIPFCSSGEIVNLPLTGSLATEGLSAATNPQSHARNVLLSQSVSDHVTGTRNTSSLTFCFRCHILPMLSTKLWQWLIELDKRQTSLLPVERRD